MRVLGIARQGFQHFDCYVGEFAMRVSGIHNIGCQHFNRDVGEFAVRASHFWADEDLHLFQPMPG